MDKENILDKTILDNAKVVEEVVYDLVKEYTKELDKIMLICRDIFNSGGQVSDAELQDLLIQLPTNMYFVSEAQEFIGLKEDISKMVKMEKYNQARKQVEGTIADKNAQADLEVINEHLNYVIYQRSYKLIRNKVEIAYELLNSLKKVNEKRILENKIGGRGER